ncbi:hypothetical protein Godav_004169 [Gossypium davidsonii]|uniref:DUF761 domain-containing protein n=2 Tax=Gossypium TaxID=3633 RepID=A0A7J8SKS8_GOSDV|nr:hypothetical protein [Gossypium davidsonii]MBA0662133.1 hypothetical protein [Gossypium klotzschianum]
MGRENWSVMGRLKRAVKQINSLLRFNLTKWRFSCFLRSLSTRRRPTLSFNDRLGLHGCIVDEEEEEEESNKKGPVRALHRTTSYASADDDVDQRAELFISNFRRQLWLERQVSLQLRYCRSRSLE